MTNATGISAALGQDQFLTLLVAQVQNQDPLNPATDKEFIAQLASLSQLQGIQSLNTSFAEMLKLQQLTQGSNLIDKSVDYTIAVNGTNVSRTGTVTAVAADADKFVLTIGTDRVGLDQITTVRS